MIKNTKNLSFTFSPKALLSVVPTVVPYGIQEFLFSLGSLDDFGYRSLFTTLEKQENYINFKNFTYTKLNCLTVLECKTTKTHYLVFKELLNIILNYFRLSSIKLYIQYKLKKPFNLYLKSLIYPLLQQIEIFSERKV